MSHDSMSIIAVLSLLLLLFISKSNAFNIVLAGGTGEIGRTLSASFFKDGQDVTILCRNAFLAASPSRVSSDFGWLGKSFLERHPSIKLRDWDGGDLLDIVGQDWIGWQDDTLAKADVVINLVGGFTQQREMATERIVRESLRVNPTALQMVVGPREEDLALVSPAISRPIKMARLIQCENIVKSNCASFSCMRLEANRVEQSCNQIKQDVYDRLR